jgi:hypothetical protein
MGYTVHFTWRCWGEDINEIFEVSTMEEVPKKLSEYFDYLAQEGNIEARDFDDLTYSVDLVEIFKKEKVDFDEVEIMKKAYSFIQRYDEERRIKKQRLDKKKELELLQKLKEKYPDE